MRPVPRRTTSSAFPQLLLMSVGGSAHQTRHFNCRLAANYNWLISFGIMFGARNVWLQLWHLIGTRCRRDSPRSEKNMRAYTHRNTSIFSPAARASLVVSHVGVEISFPSCGVYYVGSLKSLLKIEVRALLDSEQVGYWKVIAIKMLKSWSKMFF